MAAAVAVVVAGFERGLGVEEGEEEASSCPGEVGV